MVEELLDSRKLISVPRALADQLKLVSGRLGFSISAYASEALKEALRIDEMGADLKEAVDLYKLVNVQKGAGNLNITRSNFKELLKNASKKKKTQYEHIWFDSGKWYGAYLSAKLGEIDIFPFLEKDLLLSWGLDEVDVMVQDVEVCLRCTSFDMSNDETELLYNYLCGLMSELGYKESEKDVLRGIVQLKFLKTLN